MTRKFRARVGAALIPLLVVASVVAAPETKAAPAAVDYLLDRPRAGGDAVRALGARLARAAARNDVSAPALRNQLLRDKSVWLDGEARRFVEEPLPASAPTGNETTTPLSTIPDADTFLLHSKAGSNRVIYLDFDGEVVQNTAWNKNYTSGATFTAGPYDSDGVPTTFSATERNVIKSVWQRVAEDYAAFDVDVTTQTPDPSAITRSDANDQTYGSRVLITNTTTIYSSCSCGGVAYVGTFDATSSHGYYQPAFVFQRGLGTGAKGLAEAASHEAGHNLGLSHDGNATSSYYSGHGAWAPIMGSGYNKPITQWSRGEYAGANNTEDDVAVMQTNGVALRADDFGNAAASAHTLSGGGATLTGRISTPTDVDAFSISAGAGAASFSVAPVPTSPNLDVSLTVLDANGTQIAVHDPAASMVSKETANGMGAEVKLTLPAGRYTLLVAGVGAGDPRATGYSDYGSVGGYTLTASVSPPSTTDPNVTPPANTAPAAPTAASASRSSSIVTVKWTDQSSNETGFYVFRERWNSFRRRWESRTRVATTKTNVSSYSESPLSGTYRYSITAFNGAGQSTAAVSNSVTR